MSNQTSITIGPDGALWFTEAVANKIGRIMTSGQITAEYRIPTSESFSEVITSGPDGALWFTESEGNKIGRLSC
jgi:virginiamycin B lyase